MTSLGGILLAIGLLLIGLALTLKARALRQWAWRKVPGTIVTAEVRLVRENYSPVIEYTYEVDGRSFRSTRIYSLFATSNLRGSAQRIASQYRPGGHVDVYVDPDYLTEAVLKPGGDPSFLFIMFAFALLPIVVGIAMIAIG